MRTLIATSAATAATALAGALATRPDTAWYRLLRKPSWQPPSAAFPLVWTPLYLDIAASCAVAIDRLGDDPRRRDELRAYRRALGANLVLNAGWSWVFWRARRPWLAATEAAVLAVSSADLARRTARASRPAGAALLPYAAWCGFATALSVAIARRNPGEG